MHADRFQQRAIGGEITFVRDLAADFGVFVIVEVMPVGIEDAVSAEPEGLVDLKVKADGSHAAVPSVLENSEVYAAREMNLQTNRYLRCRVKYRTLKFTTKIRAMRTRIPDQA
jgi:hypothetical protein